MPWTIWTILALLYLLLDTMIRYIRFRHDPKAWTPASAAAGALLWGVAWFVLAAARRGSLTAAAVQAALFGALYIAVVLLGRRFFVR